MKLGLIAMSGVRVRNPELLALGLTLPGFVERSQVIASLPSLGLLTLAGLTPPDVEIRYLEVADLAQVNGVPEEFDAVAISSFSAQIFEAYALADRYRSLGTRVILGGLHVSALPLEALRHADAVVIGEGEPLWPAVIADLKAGNLKPVYDARSHNFNFTNSPMPRFDLLDIERYNRLTVQTQRGCPFRCEFCAASMRISPNYKIKPIDRVIAEIHAIKRIWKRPFIEFADDNSFVNKAQSKQLLRAIAKEEIHWFTESDLSVADDDELLYLLHDAGCAEILIGFESTSFCAVDGVEQRSNWKARRVDHYLEAIRKIQDRGVRVNGCFVLGLDTTGTESFEDIWNFVRQSGLYDIQITVQTAFPATPLYARLKQEGRILRDEAWDLCTLFDVNFQPTKMSVAELEAGLRNLIHRIYEDDVVAARRSAFQRNYRRKQRERTVKPAVHKSAQHRSSAA